MKLKRREFMHLSGSIATMGALGAYDAAKGLLRSPKGNTEPRRTANVYADNRKSLIAVAGGKDLKEMVDKAISLIGGFARIAIKGKTVLVKPNVVSGKKNPATTNPALVKTVVSALYTEGASKVFVGDMSALWRLPTKKNMETSGIAKAAVDAGAEPVYFEEHDFLTVDIPAGKYIQSIAVSEWIFKVDRLINLPVIKTHRSATYTICLKNFIGATHFRQRPYFVDSDHWEEVISEINMAYAPDLNIVDGTRIMVEGGPWKGQERDTNLIIAGGDRVAADIVGLAILKTFGLSKKITATEVWQQRQIVRAIELGMGAKNGSEMKLVSESLDGDRTFEDLMEKARRIIA